MVLSEKSEKKRLLLLNGAGAGKGESNLIALSEGSEVIASQILAGRGASERFAPSVCALLKQAGWGSAPDGVVAIVGPGSFTGLRASLSLASGLARGWGTLAIGLRLGDAMRASISDDVIREKLAILCLARRGRVFIDPPHNAEIYAAQISDLQPALWEYIAGDAVVGGDGLEELIGEKGCFKGEGAPHIYPLMAPTPQGMIKAAQSVILGEKQNYSLIPLYIDPPEVKIPAVGLRPAPQ